MKHALTAIFSGALAFSALAQSTPVGLWRSTDDKTGEAKAEVRILETAGVLSGKIEKRLLKTAKPEDVCIKCSDDRKDQPIIGMQVIRGAKKAEDREDGRSYTLKMTLMEDGKKLEVRGSFGPFGRTQTWVRLQ